MLIFDNTQSSCRDQGLTVPDSSQMEPHRQGECWETPEAQTMGTTICVPHQLCDRASVGTADSVLALCTGSSMMKATCGTLILKNFGV